MEIKTLIRIHGVVTAAELGKTQTIVQDTVVLENSGDSVINEAMADGWDVVEINLMYNSDNGVLFDVVYMQRGADDDDGNDESPDEVPDEPMERLMTFDNLIPVINEPISIRKSSKHDRD